MTMEPPNATMWQADLTKVVVPSAVSSIPSVAELRERLGYADTALSRVKTFQNDIRNFPQRFYTANGINGTDLLNWRPLDPASGLAELTRAWFYRYDSGRTFWPDSPLHPNYNKLQYSTDTIEIIGLMMQLFYKINYRANQNLRYKAKHQKLATYNQHGSSEDPIEIASHTGSQNSHWSSHAGPSVDIENREGKVLDKVKDSSRIRTLNDGDGFISEPTDPCEILRDPEPAWIREMGRMVVHLRVSKSELLKNALQTGNKAGQGTSESMAGDQVASTKRKRLDDDNKTAAVDQTNPNTRRLRRRKEISTVDYESSDDTDGEVGFPAGPGPESADDVRARQRSLGIGSATAEAAIEVQNEQPILNLSYCPSTEESTQNHPQQSGPPPAAPLATTRSEPLNVPSSSRHETQQTSQEPPENNKTFEIQEPIVDIVDADGRVIDSLRRVGPWNQWMESILTLPIQRNVKIRRGRKFKDEHVASLYDIREAKGIRWLSCMIQATGSVQKRRCTCCKRNQGAFAECVVVGGRLFPKCGNCEWNRQGCQRLADDDPPAGSAEAGRAGTARNEQNIPVQNSQSHGSKVRVSMGGRELDGEVCQQEEQGHASTPALAMNDHPPRSETVETEEALQSTSASSLNTGSIETVSHGGSNVQSERGPGRPPHLNPPTVKMFYSVVISREPFSEMPWIPRGLFRNMTLQSFMDQVPLRLSPEADGFLFTLQKLGSQLLVVAERDGEVSFELAKNKISVAVQQGISQAAKAGREFETFVLTIDEWHKDIPLIEARNDVAVEF